MKSELEKVKKRRIVSDYIKCVYMCVWVDRIEREREKQEMKKWSVSYEIYFVDL